jgi:RNA polymerase sigma-70 factor (ECF subfamily)
MYDSYSADVYRFAFSLSGDRFEAEDITSETFVRVWAHVTAIRTETLKAYLFTVARNYFLEQIRKRKRQVILKDVYPDPSPGPEKAATSQSEIFRVERILQSLPEIDRTAFVMRVQHNMPCGEIARVLQISLSATKVKIHRVRKKLLEQSIQKEVK